MSAGATLEDFKETEQPATFELFTPRGQETALMRSMKSRWEIVVSVVVVCVVVVSVVVVVLIISSLQRFRLL